MRSRCNHRSVRSVVLWPWSGRPLLLFSVAGASPEDPLIQKWLKASYPSELVARAPHYVLGGRLDLGRFSWWMRVFMTIGAYTKPTREKRRDMLEGFDRVDRAGLAPIVEWVNRQAAASC